MRSARAAAALAELAAAGIARGTRRVSVGLEDPRDLLADLERALASFDAATAVGMVSPDVVNVLLAFALSLANEMSSEQMTTRQ